MHADFDASTALATAGYTRPQGELTRPDTGSVMASLLHRRQRKSNDRKECGTR